jgi:transcriptional regulator with XRE-family HTH domain
MARIEVPTALRGAALGEYIREQRDQAQMSLRQLAAAANVSNPYLSQVERGLRKPSAEILGRIAQGLRISAESLYVQAGILAERDGDDAVTTAIAADRTLTERQRTTLLQIYAAFQSENRTAAKEEKS